MSGSLSSMAAAGSCLQQRDPTGGYPAYMFHDPLHSLSSTYGHSRAAAAAACNPAVAHAQSGTPHAGYSTGPGTPTSGPPASTHGTGWFFTSFFN